MIEVIAGAVRRGRVDSLCEDNLNDEMTGEAMEQALVTVACLRKLACVAAEALCAGMTSLGLLTPRVGVCKKRLVASGRQKFAV